VGLGLHFHTALDEIAEAILLTASPDRFHHLRLLLIDAFATPAFTPPRRRRHLPIFRSPPRRFDIFAVSFARRRYGFLLSWLSLFRGQAFISSIFISFHDIFFVTFFAISISRH
jgi:hypothetical protein